MSQREVALGHLTVTRNKNKTYTENFLEELDNSLENANKKTLWYKLSSDRDLSVFELQKLYNKAKEQGISITSLNGTHFAYRPNELNGTYRKLIKNIQQIYKQETEPTNHKTFLAKNQINCSCDADLINWTYRNELTKDIATKMYQELNANAIKLSFLPIQE